MEAVYEAIFSFSGGYNFLHRQVCFEFRQMISEVSYLEYLDQLCKDGRTKQLPPLTKSIVEAAIDKSLLNLLEFCVDLVPKNTICDEAAKKGKLGVLQWAPSQGYPWDVRVCRFAAMYGHLEILKWARANGCPWDKEVCSNASRGGHLEVLQWARANGCDWDRWVCHFAVMRDNLEVLKWAHENGCDWDIRVSSIAAEYGRLEILKWVIDNGCQWNRKDVYRNALDNGHEHILEWLEENF
jgi:hypothetical protein